ncbi:MAG TPA: hypothetical protein VNZ53_58570 [Steroidobacteraceae bacterium]|jgi:hypothetical protein|nr:hypothetical protein [Steroidobacteraceae bacterium]
MRTQIALQAIFVASLLGSTISAVAQTGEFGSPVPGGVVHDGWALQDYLQNLRNGTPAQPPNPPAAPSYYSDPNFAKPAVGRKTTGNGTKGQQ